MSRKGQTANRGRKMSNAEFSRLWNNPEIPAQQIADDLGISRQAVLSRALLRGLSKRKGGAGSGRKIDPVVMRAMWDANVGATEIAKHFGITNCNSVSKRARLWGFPPRNCNRHNSISVLAFFMRADAQEMRAQWELAEMVDRAATRNRWAA